MTATIRRCPSCNAECADGLKYCGSCGARLSQSSDDWGEKTGVRKEGTVVGSYRLLELIGEGGMGRVYLAEHTRLGRKVAVKMLRSELCANPAAVKRFFTEARAVNQINHENIVEITDFVENDRGDNYYIMELLQGVDLQALLEEQGVLPLARTLGIAAQCARALAAVHDAGIIHRDLKPENVFLVERAGQKDFVKLLDFGIAKLLDEPGAGPAKRSNTAAGAIMGTPDYMSPEQGVGKPIDFRSDIYAFGVLLFELSTGKKPFSGKSFGEMVIKHTTVPPPRPSKVKGLPHAIPTSLEALILGCLEKSAGRRPKDMREVQARLEATAAELSLALEWFGGSAPPRPARPRRRWAGAAVAVFVLGASAYMGLQAVGAGGDNAAATPATEAAAVARPAAPAPIEVVFESTPSGAEVRSGGRRLGTTPFRAYFPASDRAQLFELRAAGYQSADREVPLGQDTRVIVALAAVPSPRAADAAPAVAALGAGPPASPPAKATPSPRPKATTPTPGTPDKGAVFNPFK